MKAIIAIVAVIIVAVLAVLLFMGSNADLTMQTMDASITLPSDYQLDDKGVAYKGDVGVYFASVSGGDKKAQDELFKTLKSKGKDAGYKKVKTDKVNGYNLYEYSANPDKLKTVSSDKVDKGDKYTWNEYDPYTSYKDVSDMKVKKFRYVAYVKDDKMNELVIFTNNTDTDLYSGEIANIINSIAPLER